MRSEWTQAPDTNQGANFAMLIGVATWSLSHATGRPAEECFEALMAQVVGAAKVTVAGTWAVMQSAFEELSEGD